ncbi:hypothetical protein [Streptomyces rimosus]|uniref:hypothetical protein n=1 Tax=Streptomyces rimosus TaxID=1927 RepID=UPI0033DD1342
MVSTTRTDLIGAHHVVLGVRREKRLLVGGEGFVHPGRALTRGQALRREHGGAPLEGAVGGAGAFAQGGVALPDLGGQEVEESLAAEQRPEAVHCAAGVEQLEVVGAPAPVGPA